MESVAVGMGKIFKRAIGGHVLYIPAGVSKSASMGKLLSSTYVKVELSAEGKMLISPTNEDLVASREGDATKTTPSDTDPLDQVLYSTTQIRAPVVGMPVADTAPKAEILL